MNAVIGINGIPNQIEISGDGFDSTVYLDLKDKSGDTLSIAFDNLDVLRQVYLGLSQVISSAIALKEKNKEGAK